MIDWNNKKANSFLKKFYNSKKHTKEDYNNLVSALEYLTYNEHDKFAALDLGSLYYEGEFVPQDFSLAKKYYETSADLGCVQAVLNLGYIYYYGRVNGKPDYEKAFKCFSKASNSHHDDEDVRSEALYKLSDMYWNGYYVEEDKKYAMELVKPLLFIENDKFSKGYRDVLGDVATRLATFTSMDNASNYDYYLNWKYAHLAKKVVSDRYNGTWWGDKKILEKLDKQLLAIKKYADNNGLSFDKFSINNPKDYKISTFINSLNNYEGRKLPVKFIQSKIDNSALMIITAFGQYVSIPEINFVDTIGYAFVVFENALIQNDKTEIHMYPDSDMSIVLSKEGFKLCIDDETIQSAKMDHKSKVYYGQISLFDGEKTIDIKRDDFNIMDYVNQDGFDA